MMKMTPFEKHVWREEDDAALDGWPLQFVQPQWQPLQVPRPPFASRFVPPEPLLPPPPPPPTPFVLEQPPQPPPQQEQPVATAAVVVASEQRRWRHLPSDHHHHHPRQRVLQPNDAICMVLTTVSFDIKDHPFHLYREIAVASAVPGMKKMSAAWQFSTPFRFVFLDDKDQKAARITGRRYGVRFDPREHVSLYRHQHEVPHLVRHAWEQLCQEASTLSGRCVGVAVGAQSDDALDLLRLLGIIGIDLRRYGVPRSVEIRCEEDDVDAKQPDCGWRHDYDAPCQAAVARRVAEWLWA